MDTVQTLSGSGRGVSECARDKEALEHEMGVPVSAVRTLDTTVGVASSVVHMLVT